MDILKNLNEKQKQAVSITDGPLLILAGPGSGKTRTLTHKIVYLILKQVSPHNILAVTFTNKAASEMKNRVSGLLSGPNVKNQMSSVSSAMPTIGTFHSICVKILRTEAKNLGYNSSFTIYDDQDQLSLIKNIMKSFEMDTEQLPPSRVASFINDAKDNLVSQSEFQLTAYNTATEKTSKVYSEYQKRLKNINAFDFGDLITQVVFLFRENKNILEKYQNRFHYILVDEYQDTNTAQYTWLKLLAQKNNNICVVGDDAQAIYGWRNANFRNILNFQKDWPDAEIIKLEQNYRSTQNIVLGASNLIKTNTLGYPKKLWTENTIGDPIFICELGNEYEESEFIISQIERLTEQKQYQLKDFVVLYRTNAQSRPIEQMFLKYDIPYKIVGGLKFYQRQEVKDVIAWLRLLQNPYDEASVQRLERLKLKDLLKNTQNEARTKKQAIGVLLKKIKDCAGENPSLGKLLKYVIEISNFEIMLRDSTEKGEEKWQNVQELLSVAQDYGQINVREAIDTFLENVTLAQEADNIEYSSQLVHLMTLHMAKGLEFPVVFIAGCEDGLLPHSSSMTSVEELEEERRLAYVGVTRAKDRVYMLFARQRMLWGNIQSNPPSSFLHELPQENIQFKPLYEELETEEDIIEID